MLIEPVIFWAVAGIIIPIILLFIHHLEIGVIISIAAHIIFIVWMKNDCEAYQQQVDGEWGKV